jgi:hypothetical protein
LFVRSSRALLLFFAAALVGLALMLGMLFFQLSRGPISLSFLTPFIEQALNSTLDGTSIALHDTVLTWESEASQLDIRATGLQVIDSEGNAQATIPEMSVKFSARALMRGLIAPTRLELFGPRLKVVRSADNLISVGLEEAQSAGDVAEVDAAAKLVGELLRATDPNLASGYLTAISIRSALIEVDDRLMDRRIVASRANVTFVRNDEGVRVDGSVVVGEGEATIRLDLSGVHYSSTGVTDMRLVFSDLVPATLVEFEPALKMLGRIDTMLDGTIILALDGNFMPQVANVDIRASAGAIDVSPSLSEPIRFESAIFRANASDAYGRVNIDTFEIDLGETVVDVAVKAQSADGIWKAAVDGEIRDLPVDDIARYWPPGFQDNTRSWLTENIEDGEIDSLKIGFLAEVPEASPGDFWVDSLVGEIHFHNTTVHYLRPMEPFVGSAGVARFDAQQLVIDVAQARLRGIVAESGTITINGLSGSSRSETIKIEATVAGPVRDALEILDSEPLGFISDFGIDPAQTGGSQRTTAVFAFPLHAQVKMDEIAVTTTSQLTDFEAAKAAFDLPVSKGDLLLNVNRELMEVRGTAEIDGIPVGLTWGEQFEERGEVRTKYEVRAALDDAARVRLGIDTLPYLEGPLGIGLTYSVGWDGRSAGAAQFDLTEVALSLDPFDWRKAPGTEGKAFVRFLTEGDDLLSIPEIRIQAADLDAEGSANFSTADGAFDLRQLRLSRLRFGETNAVAVVTILDGGVPEIELAGNVIDLRAIVAEMTADDEEGDEDGDTPAMRIRVSATMPIAAVRLGEETRLLDAHGWLINDGTDWSDVSLRGSLSNAGRLLVRITPEGGLRQLLIESDDAGGLLRALDWVDTIRAGELRVKGTFQGTGDDEVLTGQADMQGFVLTEEPFAAKLLALASFSGIADVLSGQGITFRRAEVPFRLTENEITITDAKARGAEIGVITSGKIDRQADTISLAGEVAPAYTLNSLLANIPLIGQVLSGGSEGIFAATFEVSGSLDDPDVAVNPLSALTPGIIRRILFGFGGENNGGEPVPGPEQPIEAQ